VKRVLEGSDFYSNTVTKLCETIGIDVYTTYVSSYGLSRPLVKKSPACKAPKWSQKKVDSGSSTIERCQCTCKAESRQTSSTAKLPIFELCRVREEMTRGSVVSEGCKKTWSSIVFCLMRPKIAKEAKTVWTRVQLRLKTRC
jgi:hypothetical protein